MADPPVDATPTTNNTPPQSTPTSFTPTSGLLASALEAGPAIDTARAICPAYLPVHIDFRKLEVEYDEFIERNQDRLQRTLGSVKPGELSVLHKYTLLLQSGVFHLDERTKVAAAVVLQKTTAGDDGAEGLRSVIESGSAAADGGSGSRKREDLVWGEVGTVHFLPGNSAITSTGEGNVVCFFVFYGA